MRVPSDACPFHRPFTEDFSGCLAYQPEEVAVTSLRDKPLGTVWTCQHLEPAQFKGERGHLYPRCLLGDTASRRQALLEVLLGPRAA
jgi:hypothetical protein